MVAHAPTLATLWGWLREIPDPEIPVISIVDLGIVRDVAWVGCDATPTLRVTVTPTYSGCPAMRTIERAIVTTLEGRGVANVAIEVALAPAWTTDWLSDTGRKKLRAYGISPPNRPAAVASDTLDLIGFVDERAACPRCGSSAVTLTSRFGSTPCKSLYTCVACREPFDHFKSH